MPEQIIQSRDISIADVFHDFYVVPDYQREYVWESDQIEQLLADIRTEMADATAGATNEYFIGSIVVCPSTDGATLELIDGQQRMTTLFVILCAIRDRLSILSAPVPGALAGQISSVSTDSAGNDQFRYRVDLQYEDSGDALESIAKRQPVQHSGRQTRSIDNIQNCYDTALGFLAREFGEDAGGIRGFYGYLTNKVKLIRIQTTDVARALKIFETINDRGVGLDSMDLLKNLLFMRATAGDFDHLKTVWKAMQDRIFQIHEKPLRFLRYVILSRYDVEVLREDEIYEWLVRNDKRIGYGKAPLNFARALLDAANAYSNFLSGKAKDGTPNPFLENMRQLGGKAARQHLILLLAAQHLPGPLFDRLAREVEELFFVYVITRENTRDFERDFARWSADVRAVTDGSSLSSLIAKRFTPAKAKLADRFETSIARLRTFEVQGYRLKYLLAKLTQHVEKAAYGETETTRWLSNYSGSAFEIEHVFPEQASEAAREEFGETQDAWIASRLGNLTLVEKSINASLGNKPYSVKRPVYVQSKLLLTHSIAERPKIGVNTRIDRAVAQLEAFADWNEDAIDRRQAQLTGLAKSTWNIPSSVPAETQPKN